MNQDLNRAIIKTIAYFDTFEYPLTLIEIYKWLYQYDSQVIGLSEIIQALNSDQLKNLIAEKNGFYFLSNKDKHIDTRLSRYRITENKFRIALRAAGWLRYLEFIKLIGVCNNVGYNNCRLDSDIDFFIITKKGYLWWTRFWVTLLLTWLGLRRHGSHAADRICLSFYLADSDLDLSSIALKPDDPYLVYWFATLAPIYDRLDSYQNILAANSWLKKYLPNFYPVSLSQRRRVIDSWISLIIKRLTELMFFGSFGSVFETVAEKIQRPKVNRYFGANIDAGNTNVVISRQMLKFHKTDRRAEYRQLWQQKIANLNL